MSCRTLSSISCAAECKRRQAVDRERGRRIFSRPSLGEGETIDVIVPPESGDDLARPHLIVFGPPIGSGIEALRSIQSRHQASRCNRRPSR
jgi:hypothetical protein